MSSAVTQYQTALTTALRGDVTLTTLLTTSGWSKAKVLAPPVPENTPAPYITLGNADEVEKSFFASDGCSGECFLHGWAKTRFDALTLYTHMFRILNRNNLALTDGLTMHLARIELIMVSEDPNTEGLWHCVAKHAADFRG